ncbi:MAG: hypothetical protein K0Q95_2563 [Bacteroidota bacterium]|jgi:gliding motility-associated-like protein|nr:hypothetical protein [Bacteroidota bacterium]
MKKILFFVSFLLVNYLNVSAQGTCATAQAFCSSGGVTFPASTNTQAPAGPNYGCLGSEPNPAWYYLNIGTSGNIQIGLSSSPAVDIDFALWGPFATQASMCAGLSASPIDCSYSSAATEQVDITGAVAGQWYMLLITNFSNQPTQISAVTQNAPGTDGTTNCAILCNMTAMTATPGACNPATSTFNLTGTITTANPPTTGTLTITSSCGGSVTVNPPFSASYNYTLPNLNANGAACTVTATFSADPTCTLTRPYTAPAPCNPACTITAGNSGPVCESSLFNLTSTNAGAGYTYSWSGPGGFTSSNQNPTGATASAVDGTYTYTVTAVNGTTTCSATTTLTVNPIPVIAAPASASVCSGDAAFNLTADVTGGTWSGTGISNATNGTFTPSSAAAGNNIITYAANGCSDTIHIFVTPGADASWTGPASICVLDPAVDLTTYLTGTAGGTWSGTGVTGTMFDPSGLSGNIAITYTVGTAPCVAVSTQNIYVNPNVPPVIQSNITSICANASPITLTADIPGGVWMGSGVNATTGVFDPSIPSTTITDTIIYDITGSCRGADTIFVTVNPAANAAWTTASVCSNNAPLNLDSLAALASGDPGGAWSGTGVTGNMFNPAGLSGPISIKYIVGGICPDSLIQNITVTPMGDPSWTTTSVCQVSSAINLDNLVTGTAGGTWSGTGVTGNMFDPTGLSGPVAITYTAGANPCQQFLTQNITVIPMSDASWTTTSICASDSIDLDTTVTGTAGGVWSGTGVTDSMFYGTGLNGLISITYTVGPVGCQASTTHDISVTPVGDAAWTTTTVCSGNGSINLNNLVTGTAGGTWSGTGVTGNTFDPTGLSGNISVKYIVGTAPCNDSLTQDITVIPSASSGWVPQQMCANDAPVNLDTYLTTGTPGGTWSGTGVTGNTFSPSGLSGFIPVTYTVGTAPCVSTTTQTIMVNPNADATITTVAPVCESATPFTFTAATTGGTWSSTGSGLNSSTGFFNPFVASAGTYTITYTIPGLCGDSDAFQMTVLPTPSAAFSLPLLICENGASVNLSSTVIGATGGTFSGTGVSNNTFDPSGLTGSTAITYSVVQNGCSATSTQIAVVDSINANFSATPLTGMSPLEVAVFENSYNAITYSWNFGNGTTSTDQFPGNTVYTGMGDYQIVLITTSTSGCLDTAEVVIHVDEVSALAMPNIFTPNGDDKNDTFRPYIREGIVDFKATVYDRWGKVMHEWSDVYEGWDGQTKSGKLCPDGTYFYIVTGKGVDGKAYEYSGFVQLFN